MAMRLLERLPAGTVRLRLALLYSAMFALSGAVLLAITYLLVQRSSSQRVLYQNGGGPPQLYEGHVDLPEPYTAAAAAMREFNERQHAAQLHELLVQSGTALAIMFVVSLALGWVVAGRVLHPLRTMTTTIREISERNLHERLGLTGPRDELTNLADTVDDLLTRMEAAFEAQRRFVASAAHELRTPLTLEHALLEETLTDPAAGLDSCRTTFRRLLANSEQHTDLLDALLTLASSERGLERRTPVDLSELVRRTLRQAKPEIDRHGVTVTARLDNASALGDAALLERLIVNLLDNAVRHNIPQGSLVVSTTTESGSPTLVVANTGTVIPPDQVDRLLEPFQRLAASRTAHDGGHGLGLSIVRAIATAHQASLTVTPRSAGGLTVEVRFPEFLTHSRGQWG
ncbi:sensor histidine kinase [Flindersiella endophytica]